MLAVSFFTTGCGSIYPRYLGIRPDSPAIVASYEIQAECGKRRHKDGDPRLISACEMYLNHVDWAKQLGESYRTRATMNEWSVYIGGTIALGALGAVGGLGLAAAAATTTIALIGVSSGFAAGFFALLDNKTRAGFYTVAANDIASAVTEADKIAGIPTDPDDYIKATGLLTEKVTLAANLLETKRYEAAAAAAATAQREESNKKLEELVKLASNAAAVSLTPSSGPGADTTKVSLKTTGIDDLNRYAGRIKILADGRPLDFSISGKETIDVMIPPKPAGKDRVTVRLQVDSLTLPGEPVYEYK